MTATALIADDSPQLRRLMTIVLEAIGGISVVAEAADGIHTVQLAAAHQPDLIVLDVCMPIMDGLEALPVLRRSSPRSKVVVLSALDPERVEAAALELGASAFVAKGTPISTMIETMRGVLADPDCDANECAVTGKAERGVKIPT